MSKRQNGAFAPLYKKLSKQLSSDIAMGTYPIGALLPTEAELCNTFGVSRITCRAALRELRNAGLVTSLPGVGTRVIASTAQGPFLHSSDSVETIIQFTDDLVFEVLEVSEQIIDSKQQAEWLGCSLGERLVVLKGLRVPEVSGADPVCLSVHYIRGVDRAQFTRGANKAKGSLTQLTEQLRGKHVGVIRQSVEAARISGADARVLNVARGEAALFTWRWYMTNDEEMLMVSNSTFPRGRYAWTMTVRRTS